MSFFGRQRGPFARLRHIHRPRNLRLESLEQRNLLAASVFLDYGDGSAANDFTTRLDELAASLAVAFPTPSEVDQIKAALNAGLQSAFNQFTVSFSDTPPAGPYDTLSLGRRASDVAGANPQAPGYAAMDWRNLNLDGPGTIYVFPANLSVTVAGLPRAQQLVMLENALAYFSASELGQSFGLQHADAFGDPSITPATYANTSGIQNRHYLSDAAFGLNPSSFSRSTQFTFSPLERAKLEFASQLTATPASTQPETAPAAHSTPATAQPLVFQSLPISQSKAAVVELANVADEVDLYSFTAGAGDLVTAHVLASSVYPTPPPFNFDSQVRLLGTNGSSVLATSDDVRLGVNAFGDVNGTQAVDTDSLIINFRIPAAGTYYLEVTAKLQNPGFYDLFAALWSPVPHPWQNSSLARDVTSDGAIVARDALRVINEINRVGGGGRSLPNPPVGAENPVVVTSTDTEYYYFDVNGDDFVTPIDALAIINFLNAPSLVGSEGEGASSALAAGSVTTATREVDLEILSLLFANDDWLSPARRR